MTINMPNLRILFLTLGIALPLIGSPTSSPAQTVVVMVNGDPITDFDIEQRSKLNALTSHKTPARQEVINELIDERLKIKEGKKFGVEPTYSDIDESFSGMASRMRMSSDQLVAMLASKGIRADTPKSRIEECRPPVDAGPLKGRGEGCPLDTLRSRIKAEMVWSSLVRGRYKERLQVSDKEVAAKVEAEGGEKLQTEGFEYKMQPVVLIVPRGSPQAAVQARLKEAETLRGRVQSCAEANSYFRSMQNAAIRDVVTKTSADIPANVRKVLDDTPVGRLTPPEVTKQGIEMAVLCARNQTMIDSPKRRETKEKMYTQKYESTSKTYLQEVRKAAMIEYR